MKSIRMPVALCVLVLFSVPLRADLPGAKSSLPAAPTHEATAAAKKKLQESQAALAKANGTFGRVTESLRKVAETSPEWAEANAALLAARTKYEAAHSAVVDKLPSSSSIYSTSLQTKKQAEEQKETVLKDSTSTPQQRMDAANAVMAAGKQVTAIEADACAADPRLVEAKKEFADASAKVQKLNADFEATVKDKPEWQTAKQDQQTAMADVKKSKDDVVAAQQADAQADATYQQEVAAANKAAQAASYKKK